RYKNPGEVKLSCIAGCLLPHYDAKMIKRNLLYLIAVLLNLLGCTVVSFSQTCDFTYVAQELPLLTLDSEDMTEKLTGEDWDMVKGSIPNVKMFFGSEEPYFSVGLGWAELPENYASLTREQAIGRLRQMLELGSWRRELEGHEFEYDLLSDDPISALFVLDYTDGGTHYWDMGIDIVATPECLVSLKISTAIDELTEEELNHLQESLTSLRRIVVARHGAVQFDAVGTRLTLARLINQMILLGAFLGVAAIFYGIYSWNYLITPGKASRRYSAFIVMLAGLMIIFTFLVNELVGFHIAESRNLHYEGLIHWFFALFLHAWSYKTQSPFAVLASVSYIVAGLTLNLWLVLFGWMAPTTGMVGGLIGTLLVFYVLKKSATRKKLALAPEEEKSEQAIRGDEKAGSDQEAESEIKA
ncbi:hypothetical protein MYX65_13225, partial [Acidobacteria bacterium AH-259-L09]|nr:hypothetical protein [Acidobacteria bacterium AH-259-L09]